MRISDWSSDVCSSDLRLRAGSLLRPRRGIAVEMAFVLLVFHDHRALNGSEFAQRQRQAPVRDVSPVERQTPGRKLDAPLEAAMRHFEAMDDRGAIADRHEPAPGPEPQTALADHPHPPRPHPGQGENDTATEHRT